VKVIKVTDSAKTPVEFNGKLTKDKTLVVGGVQVKEHAKELKKAHENVAGDLTENGVYTNRVLAVPKKEDIINDGVTGVLKDPVSEQHKDAVQKQSGTAYALRKGYSIGMDVLTKDETLQKEMGYIPEEYTIDVLKPSTRGRNRQIQETIDYLSDAVENIGYDTNMFAKWKVITNNRFMIDSTQLDWQNKILHRFAVRPVEDDKRKN